MPDQQNDQKGVIAPDTEEHRAFIKGLMERKQAAKRLPDGSLPKDVTHEIVGEGQDGLPIVKRERFY
jgi:hypothetical protein